MSSVPRMARHRHSYSLVRSAPDVDDSRFIFEMYECDQPDCPRPVVIRRVAA